MIKDIIGGLNKNLECLELFQNIFGLGFLQKSANESQEITQPVVYDKDGELIAVADHFDSDIYGLSYWRKTGDVSVDHIQSAISTNNDVQFIYPLQLFGLIKRSILKDDDEFADDLVCLDIIKELVNDNWADLKQTIGAKRLVVEANGYSNDRNQIINNEFAGTKLDDIDFAFAVFTINFKITVLTNKNCINGCV